MSNDKVTSDTVAHSASFLLNTGKAQAREALEFIVDNINIDIQHTDDFIDHLTNLKVFISNALSVAGSALSQTDSEN